MAAVKVGGNRQQLHERIRQHSQEAAAQVKQLGKVNDLMDRLKADKAFDKVDFKKVLNPKNYIGRSPQQVDEFIKIRDALLQRDDVMTSVRQAALAEAQTARTLMDNLAVQLQAETQRVNEVQNQLQQAQQSIEELQDKLNKSYPDIASGVEFQTRQTPIGNYLQATVRNVTVLLKD